jgi:hypothetical protein
MGTNVWSVKLAARGSQWSRTATDLSKAAISQRSAGRGPSSITDTTARLHQLCERWIYSTCLCFALPDEDRKRSHFQYQYSVFHLELSRNLLFWRGTTMNEVYQRLIDRTREPLALSHVKTIFGFSYRPHQIVKRGRERTEVSRAVQAKKL